MKPANMEDMVEATEPAPKRTAQWPGEAADAPEDDPAYDAIKDGIFEMTPEELDALQRMIDESRARLEKANPDPGGDIKL